MSLWKVDIAESEEDRLKEFDKDNIVGTVTRYLTTLNYQYNRTNHRGKRQPHSPLLQNIGEYMWTVPMLFQIIIIQLSRELSAIRAANPPSDNIALQESALLELPHRALSERPNIFRYDKKGNLIVIVDDRNVKQVFGEKLANAIMMRSQTNSD
ncbi:hypothetical protein C1646_761429 [Rhizophagus diaphanus]|nr:hypothetical protein C1646_761429 [Rhizophagus diaphanus] [Rhizophagus sp. MUCL 43196]